MCRKTGYGFQHYNYWTGLIIIITLSLEQVSIHKVGENLLWNRVYLYSIYFGTGLWCKPFCSGTESGFGGLGGTSLPLNHPRYPPYNCLPNENAQVQLALLLSFQRIAISRVLQSSTTFAFCLICNYCF